MQIETAVFSQKDGMQLPQIKSLTYSMDHFGDFEVRFIDWLAPVITNSAGVLHPAIVELMHVSGGQNICHSVRIHNTDFSVLIVNKRASIYTLRAFHEINLLKWSQLSPHAPELDHALLELTDWVRSYTERDLSNCLTEIEFKIKQHALLPLTQDFSSWDDQILASKYALAAKKTDELRTKLLQEVNSYKSSLFEKLTDYSLKLTSEYELMRLHLLKFLAILPCLDHDRLGTEVKRVFLEALRRFLEDGKKSVPAWMSLSVRVTYYASMICPALILAFILRISTKYMAKRFIAGQDVNDFLKTFKALSSSGRDATLDQLGELVLTPSEADKYQKEVLHIIGGLKDYIPAGEKNAAGIERAHVSIKVTALAHHFKPQDFNYTYAQVAPRLKEILIFAKEQNVFVNVDAEHDHYREIVWDIFAKVIESDAALMSWPGCGIVIQAYLKNAFEHFVKIKNFSDKRKVNMPVRLVKGAYWDAETIEGRAHSFDAPQFLNKVESDLMYRALGHEILASSYLQLSVASHNIDDHCWFEAVRECVFPNAKVIEHQCLHMTYEALSRGLAQMNWPTRNYAPLGDLLVGMAYLVRRIMENSSQVGFLSMMRSHKSIGAFELLCSKFRRAKDSEWSWDDNVKLAHGEFFNAPALRSYHDQYLHEFKKQDERLKRSLPLQFAVGGDSFKLYSPSHPDKLIGEIEKTTTADVKKILTQMQDTMVISWWSRDHLRRAACLLKFSFNLTANRDKLTSLIMLESGKTLDEASADVDEAIDFVNFYGVEQLKIEHEKKNNHPIGVIAAITPWNFPLAIACGMSVAPLWAGNAVVVKSAEQTPLIAQAMAELLFEAGVPKNIFAHIVGLGEEVGEAITSHPGLSMLVFTGSKKVGTYLYQKLSTQFFDHFETKEKLQKRVITEMGGKNAIIVTNNCELDETISGIIYAAFAHAGQKCSAASRIIVDEKIKDTFIKRLSEAVSHLKVGDNLEFSTFINPLITGEDKLRVIETAKACVSEAKEWGGKVHLNRVEESRQGHCVGPLLVELPFERALHRDSFAQREIFAPVLHIIPYQTLEEAVVLFNSTEYALTGGIYAQSQDDIDTLLSQLQSGNLYINRPNTGARVAIEPFGGFKLSGTGPKAGSRDYMKSFQLFGKSTIGRKMGEPSSLKSKNEARESFIEPISAEMMKSAALKVIAKIKNKEVSLIEYFSEKEKTILTDLENYLKKGSLPNKINNRVIPGQISYNDYRLAKGEMIIVSTFEAPTLMAVIDFLFSLLAGRKISIIATNQQNFFMWSTMVAWIENACDEKTFVAVTLMSVDEMMESLFSMKKVSYLIDAPKELFADLLQKVETVELGVDLIKFINTAELELLDSFAHWEILHREVRSVAVNVMRHGAPLESATVAGE